MQIVRLPRRQHETDHTDHTDHIDHTDQECTYLPCLADLGHDLGTGDMICPMGGIVRTTSWHRATSNAHLSSTLWRVGKRWQTLFGCSLQKSIHADHRRGISRDANDTVRHEQCLGGLVKENDLVVDPVTERRPRGDDVGGGR